MQVSKSYVGASIKVKETSLNRAGTEFIAKFPSFSDIMKDKYYDSIIIIKSVIQSAISYITFYQDVLT